ncbi:hypothetical protein Naga_102611g1 [Nannochloropsis gaditana]|uniref:Uncharacterized protein n=1 Tax=Nannochloropsis gaditana TaxID=72520 RepID=W7T906_9STRA|nr:hypothetical protein Naga_102611g1 [Nannochloropsis gaditana]
MVNQGGDTVSQTAGGGEGEGGAEGAEEDGEEVTPIEGPWGFSVGLYTPAPRLPPPALPPSLRSSAVVALRSIRWPPP